MDNIRKHASLIALVLIILFGLVSLWLASQDALTFDERAHIPAAYSYVRYGDIRLNPEHPPLLKDLAGLPLLFLQPQFPLASPEWQEGPNKQWEVGSMFLNCSEPELACNNTKLLTFWSRLPLVLVAMALAFFLFRWARSLAGPLAGLTALILMVGDPNVLAHGHLVTTDIGIAAFLTFAFYFFLRFLKFPSWKNTFLAALFFSLVQVVKFSAVLLFPLFFLVLVGYVLCLPAQPNKSRLRILGNYLVKSLVIILFYVVFVYGIYYFHTLGTPTEHLVGTADLMFSERGLGPWAEHAIRQMSTLEVLKPFTAYLLGVFMVFGRVAGGNMHYFLGTVGSDAQTSYFPVLFLTKETLPFLILLGITLCYSLVRFTRNTLHPEPLTTAGIRVRFVRHIDAILIFSFVALYSFLSIFGNLNIGFRHLFPIVPLLYLWIAKTVFTFLRDQRIHHTTRELFGFLIAILLGFQIFTAALSFPYYLPYYNSLAGGTGNGYTIATDSNYDWGQDLGRLRTFIAYHNHCADPNVTSTLNCDRYLPELPPIEKIRVDYFGGESPSRVLGSVYEGWWSERPQESGWYALSINTLQENWTSHSTEPNLEGPNYLWLQKYQPVTRAGQSIFIYYIP